MKTEFDNDWKNWIKTNVDNGQDKNGIDTIWGFQNNTW